jgi:hypothetical protein
MLLDDTLFEDTHTISNIKKKYLLMKSGVKRETVVLDGEQKRLRLSVSFTARNVNSIC